MKVAIMGAGLSGLVSAITLEKHGIVPTIFESRDDVGDRFINGEVLLNILSRPINNSLEHFANKYDIHLKPTSILKQINFYSKNAAATIKGTLGYTNIRGRHEDSFENQLKKQVKSEITFNSKYTHEYLAKHFDYVILATGDGEYARKLGNYRCDLSTSLKGTTVEGNFIKDKIIMWTNYDFAPKGYAYLIPFSDKEAHIVIAYPDYDENIKKDINTLWEMFYEQACKDTKQNLHITDEFQISKYMIGISHKPRIDNTLFVGNCFGSISPSFGFGQYTSILTGIYAAHHILGIQSYEDLTKPLYTNYNNSLVIRRFMESLNNKKLDLLIKSFNMPLVNSAFSDTSKIDFFKIVSYPLRPITSYLK